MRDMYNIEPVCIIMGMRDVTGQVFTSYWQADPNDFACIVDAIQSEAMLNFIRLNKDEIMAILNEEGDEEDGLCESDSEADNTG